MLLSNPNHYQDLTFIILHDLFIDLTLNSVTKGKCAVCQLFCLNSDLDKASDGLSSSESRSLSLGNTGLLSLDPVEDRTALYDKLLETYDWHEKVPLVLNVLFSVRHILPTSCK